MDQRVLRLGIGEPNAAYADCIDDNRHEEWPDFFVADSCRYLVTGRPPPTAMGVLLIQ